MNYAGRTIELGTCVTDEEAEWLMQELKEYIAAHGSS